MPLLIAAADCPRDRLGVAAASPQEAGTEEARMAAASTHPPSWAEAAVAAAPARKRSPAWALAAAARLSGPDSLSPF